MLQVICDKCGKNCDRHAYMLTVQVISNPSPLYPFDIGDLKITDTHLRMHMVLCQDDYRRLGLPNIYTSERTGELRFRSRSADLVDVDADDEDYCGDVP